MGEPGRDGLAPIEWCYSGSNLVSARPPSPRVGEFPQFDGDIAMTDPQAVPDIRRYQAHAELFDKLQSCGRF